MLRKLFYIALLLPFIAQSQINLVPNPSFEEVIECPEYELSGGNIHQTNYWQNGNLRSPDFFHACANEEGPFFVPENSWGLQNPLTGDAYAGIYPFNYPFDARE